MLWLCLRCTDLSLAAAGVSDPDLPQVVAERQRVYCPDQAAAASGVAVGMALANALALCPGLAIRPRAPAREQAILAALAHACHHLTPRVTLCPPAALLLEVSGSLKLFGGLAALLAAVRDTLRLQQVHAAIGAAPTPAAAQLLSHGDADPLDYLDAHSGALTRPRAFTRRLHALPLTALDCTPELVEKLARTGLRRVGEVLQLPGSALGRRYGRDFVHYLERIRGQRPDPQTAMPLASSFSRRLEFGAAIERAEMLLFPARRLLHELSGYLRARQMHCGRLNWTLHQEHGAPFTLPLRLARPRGDLAHLLELTRLGFATLRLEGPVAALTLASDELHPAQGANGDLLSTLVPPSDPAGIQTLCDRLTARLGPAAIARLTVRNEHLPERASVVLPPTATAAGAVASPPPAPRPVWLVQPPAPVSVQGGKLYWDGPLILLRGPERIESDWWRTPARRDYYLARHGDGRRCWLYRERHTGAWFVHGLFG
ncbi:MAG: DNA polymerase Y family protein [Porticoccaceae bacterium]